MTTTEMNHPTFDLQFSAIEVVDLAGLQKILPENLNSSGPHLVGRLKDHAAFMMLELLPPSRHPADEKICEGFFYPGRASPLSAWQDNLEDIDGHKATPLHGAYPHQIGADILALDRALGFKHSDDEKWLFTHDQTKVIPGIWQRAGWHLDQGVSRAYLVAIPDGPVMLKDTAPNSLKALMNFDDEENNESAEAEARSKGLIVDAEPGDIYLIGEKTWHRSPGDGSIPKLNSPPQRMRDRTFMALASLCKG